MKIDKGMYNDVGYEFDSQTSVKVQWWFNVIHKLLFIGNPPYYNIELAYALRSFILKFYKKYNLIK